MHFCQDEVFALMMVIPGLTAIGAWLKNKWHCRKHCKCHKELNIQ